MSSVICTCPKNGYTHVHEGETIYVVIEAHDARHLGYEPTIGAAGGARSSQAHGSGPYRTPPRDETVPERDVDPFDGAVEENERGGRQSGSPYFFSGLPPRALRRVARILKEGAERYEETPFEDVGRRNWHKIPSEQHAEHAMAHWVAYLGGIEPTTHLGHMATRALFALHMHMVEHPEETP